MRILYDHQVFSLQNAGGASRYHYELACHLSSFRSVGLDMYLGFNGSVYSFTSLKRMCGRILNWKTKLRPGLTRYALNEFVTGVWALSGGRWDIYHPTLYRSMPFVRSRRMVVTHYDCVHERFPELFSDGQRVVRAKRRLYSAADLIICISESSRTDLLRFYDIKPTKTRVVYLGVTKLEQNREK